ncbi:nuclear transport factor 2 family protein [Georgenia satyanarayanai]|uniref:nuclear transport factor 2 family protein n=1 Tax=Georgenia satyanarayanai TaxID=860221 RepID=UPI0012640E37|nr:nuclear transport factor 2 family protein [Georgenia satyanarayanai]
MSTPEELERLGWRALSSGPDRALAFYDEVLDDDVRMLFPGGLLLAGRRQVLASMAGPPWDTHELTDLDVLEPTPDVAVVSYRVEAERAGSPYTALVASVYVRRAGGWRLVSHQHTPR